jgi:ornithine--oxo-acid transaminase
MAILGKVLEIYERDELWERASKSGSYFLQGLQKIDSPYITEARGKGLAIGIELNSIDAKEFLNRLLREERIFTVDAHGVIRLTPALNIEKWEMGFGIDGIKKVLKKF